jgi:hypothetical protein
VNFVTDILGKAHTYDKIVPVRVEMIKGQEVFIREGRILTKKPAS